MQHFSTELMHQKRWVSWPYQHNWVESWSSTLWSCRWADWFHWAYGSWHTGKNTEIQSWSFHVGESN